MSGYILPNGQKIQADEYIEYLLSENERLLKENERLRATQLRADPNNFYSQAASLLKKYGA